MTVRGMLFRVVVRVISLGCVVRDRALGRLRPIAVGAVKDAVVERHSIRSGRNLLDALYVRPAEGEARSVLLICHGIGEAVEHWYPVQLMLAAKGAASLVFDYSGYGRSTGAIGAAQCDEDAVAAFEFLEGLVPSRRIALLGFSMGGGVVASILGRVKPERVVLCAAFTSFKAAVRVLGLPRFLAEPIWNTVETLRGYDVPVLIVHGEKDQLFPVSMARELAESCGAELMVVPGLRHNEPFYQPDLVYWGSIVEWLGRADI